MELKSYQQKVLTDLRHFNECLAATCNLREAFRKHWDDKGVALQEDDDFLHEYVNTVKGVPRVTLKVPTAGGKTFIACNALRTIFDALPEGMPKAVAWFVPYDTIQKQTYRRLSDPTDPYRQRINTLFGGRVRVYDKEALLTGQNFNPTVVREQLSIFVLSVQSFASTKKDVLRARRENENLTSFAATYTANTPRVNEADETSLMQVLASLQPVVIIDESHNFTADLRVETLQALAPRYILELTATPRQQSNIVSFIDASQLKAENMVKLPVIVYNQSKVDEVVGGAIQLQRNLEAVAQEAEAEGGNYIRPIVLFQAQPKNADDNTTFDKVKAKLVEIGLPEEQIKIKVTGHDELQGIDLMSRDCPVRYIITVDALKEGWDCPFAYILASLANRTSRISVEQILGRILRQPYTKRHSKEMLNLSYVLTCSSDFQDTLKSIVKSLNNAGFSGRNYVAMEKGTTTVASTPAPQPNLFDNPLTTAHTSTDTADINTTAEADIDKIDIEALKASNKPTSETAYLPLKEMEQRACEEAARYNDSVAQSITDNDSPQDIMERVKSFKIKACFAHEANSICLPQFFIKTTANELFGDREEDMLLSTNHLMEGFRLSTQDRNINFAQAHVEAMKIDLEERYRGEYVPQFRSMNEQQLRVFSEYINGLTDEAKLRQLTQKLYNILEKKYKEIASAELSNYIASVLNSVETYKLQGLADNILNTLAAFEQKIDVLAANYRQEQFRLGLDTGRITCKPSYSLPNHITPKDYIIGIAKGLYAEEEKVDGFEERVINQIANLDNVLFWHRNLERGRGFCINGFINHYPDFIVKLKNGRTLLIETKGDHLDGSNSEDKLRLGMTWANKAGEEYRYFMVFDKKEVAGAYTLPAIIGLIQQMS